MKTPPRRPKFDPAATAKWLLILAIGYAALGGETPALAAGDGPTNRGPTTVFASDRIRGVATRPLGFTGVNLAGGEFGDPKPGARRPYGVKYIYPSGSEMDYFARQGVNIIRFPFRWADLQPALRQPLDQAALDRVKDVVGAATRRGLVLILDPHDYARYEGKVVGGLEVPNAAFADFWARLAAPFKDQPRVWFGLMNEPHDLPAQQWLGAANAAIAAIRSAGATNRILVPGTAWTGAHSWVASGNGEVMMKIVDPQDYYLIEVHQYLDKDSSGTKPEAVSPTIGSERLQQFTEWCRAHHRRALLGEFGAPNNATAARAVDDMLHFMEKNREVWAGFTWWAAGAWWGDYMFTLEPKNGQDRPQMMVLRPHLQQAGGIGNQGRLP
jgi:endoglucanase